MATHRKAENTRKRIIDSARKLFAEKGYQKTTVIDISKAAGLSEAALYDYFKGKEDLLHTIPGIWVAELLQGLDEQMFGLQGAFTKLRKYLYWNLKRVEDSPLDAKLVYLFLKHNAEFMNTEVYGNVKKFYAYLINIFEEGKKSGEMKQDMDSYAARSIFIGTMDYMITRWLLKERSYPLLKGMDEVYELLVAAFASKRYLSAQENWKDMRLPDDAALTESGEG
jgi:TetR/AcrR family fatty acid metabolism transcriptional regulator